MSLLYLIRHGQAGSRDHYDRLSELGERQAALLGRYLCGWGVRFTAAYCGALRRQHQTAQLALSALGGAPELRIDPRWNEFDLEGLWRVLAPRLMAENQDFARNYDLLHRNNPRIDRTMTVCDTELIRTWMRGSHPCNGLESWADFRSRVEETASTLAAHDPDDVVAVFTSATPIATWSSMAFDREPRSVFRIVGVLLNSSFSTFSLSGGEVRLLTLNNAPHLVDPSLRTLR
jgi:broad specificity phosphatase PhoE